MNFRSKCEDGAPDRNRTRIDPLRLNSVEKSDDTSAWLKIRQFVSAAGLELSFSSLSGDYGDALCLEPLGALS